MSNIKLIIIKTLLLLMSLNAASVMAEKSLSIKSNIGANLSHEESRGIYTKGKKNTLKYQIYLGYPVDNKNKILSAFHGINLLA